MQAGVALLITPIYVAGAVSDEKEKHSLDFLLVTSLRNHEIVWMSRSAARLLHLFALLLAGLPVLALTNSGAAFDLLAISSGFAATACQIVSLGAFAILCSVLSQRTAGHFRCLRRSNRVQFIFPLLAVPPIGITDCSADQPQRCAGCRPRGNVHRTNDPVRGLARAYRAGMPRHCHPPAAPVRRALGTAAPPVGSDFGGRGRAAAARFGRVPPVATAGRPEPHFLERLLPGSLGRKRTRRLHAGSVTAYSFWRSAYRPCWSESPNSAQQCGDQHDFRLPVVAEPVTADRCGVSPGGQRDARREQRTLESLQTLPLSPSAILRAKWLAGVWRGHASLITSVSIAVFGSAIGVLQPLSAGLLLLAFGIHIIFVANLAMCLSVYCRTTVRAHLAVFAILIVVLIGTGMVGTLSPGPIPQHSEQFTASIRDTLNPLQTWYDLMFGWNRDREAATEDWESRTSQHRLPINALVGMATYGIIATLLGLAADRGFRRGRAH